MNLFNRIHLLNILNDSTEFIWINPLNILNDLTAFIWINSLKTAIIEYI